MTISPLNTGTSAALGYGVSKLVTSAQATIDAVTKKSEEQAAAGNGSSGVSISLAARIAAAEQADNAKDFTVLSQNMRSALDAQYAAASTNGTSTKPDLTEMSGRALAAIALNKTGAFSRPEMAAAKNELNQRTREELTSAFKSGNALDALVSYNAQLMTDYDGMSQEERDARGWTADIRASAEAFVTTVNGSDTAPSLFDLLASDDNS